MEPRPQQHAPQLHTEIISWFTANARDLPWRKPDCSPWGIFVSEIMLQQTPVVRVLPVWEQWMARWPDPAALAAEPSGEAVRAWGRLGYPRRALRLHAAATAMTADFGGAVPRTAAELLTLPGVGTYTAAAVASFAFGRREAVVDTNIRRVHARAVTGKALPAPALTAAEMRLAADLLPDDDAASVAWNASVMELGALVCTARSPLCEVCPVRRHCAWVAAGRPAPDYVPKGQSWAGTDRQVRGALMAVLRHARSPVLRTALLGPADLAAAESVPGSAPMSAPANPEQEGPEQEALLRLHALNAPAEQLERALAGLLTDRLAEETGSGLQLPG